MTFACVLLLTVLACFIGRRFIHRHPAVLYVFAVAVDAAYLAAEFFGAPFWLWNPLFLLVQKCLLALALFVVVMGIGCFSRASSVSVWLRPVRAELSIAACLLAVGHMVAYVGTYVSRLAMGSAKDHVVLAFAVAMALTVLLAMLGVTSVSQVKRRMKADAWARLQKGAYVFFGLVYVHLALMLVPAASRGGASAQESLAVYTAVFGVYAVARIYRAVCDARERRSTESALDAVAPSAAVPSPPEWEEAPAS